MAKLYTESQVASLLDALETKASEIGGLLVKAQQGISRDSLDGYLKFRELSTEFDAFCIIVDMRLNNMKDDAPVASMRLRYDDCVFAVSRTLVDASLRILFALSDRQVLPLGSKDVFLTELKSLYYTRERLGEDRFESRIDEATKTQLGKAEQILMQIIDRAPAMLDLGGGR
ncbi:MAG TPA: hypothetical protein VGA18_09120 [Rhodothermales bacterium]